MNYHITIRPFNRTVPPQAKRSDYSKKCRLANTQDSNMLRTTVVLFFPQAILFLLSKIFHFRKFQVQVQVQVQSSRIPYPLVCPLGAWHWHPLSYQKNTAFASHTAPIVMATTEETIDSLRGMSGWSRAFPTLTLPSPIKVVVADMATCGRRFGRGERNKAGGREAGESRF